MFEADHFKYISISSCALPADCRELIWAQHSDLRSAVSRAAEIFNRSQEVRGRGDLVWIWLARVNYQCKSVCVRSAVLIRQRVDGPLTLSIYLWLCRQPAAKIKLLQSCFLFHSSPLQLIESSPSCSPSSWTLLTFAFSSSPQPSWILLSLSFTPWFVSCPLVKHLTSLPSFSPLEALESSPPFPSSTSLTYFQLSTFSSSLSCSSPVLRVSSSLPHLAHTNLTLYYHALLFDEAL